MCGRLACTLTPQEICQACSYKGHDGKYHQAEWTNPEKSVEFKPLYNIGPRQAIPVLVSKSQFYSQSKPGERLVVPMIWGLISPNHKGTMQSHSLSTFNCRSETVTTSPLYSPLFQQGKRCVMLCDGFFEWQHLDKNGKQPFFIYLPQPEKICIENRETWHTSWSATEGWHGPRLLSLAAIFSVWKSPEGKLIHTVSILTMNSSSQLKNIHKRMPVILDTEKKINLWLNQDQVCAKEALKVVNNPEELSLHPVTPAMGNVRFENPLCVQPLKSPKKNIFMSNWLHKSPEKKIKKEADDDMKDINSDLQSKVHKSKPEMLSATYTPESDSSIVLTPAADGDTSFELHCSSSHETQDIRIKTEPKRKTKVMHPVNVQFSYQPRAQPVKRPKKNEFMSNWLQKSPAKKIKKETEDLKDVDDV